MKYGKSMLGFILTIAVTTLLFYLYFNKRHTDPFFLIEYNEGLQHFDAKFVEHFPTNFATNSSRLSISEDRGISHPGVWLKTKLDKEAVDTLFRYLKSVAVASYDPSDSCLIIVDSHLTDGNRLTYDKTSRNSPELRIDKKDCQHNMLAVPKFWSHGMFESNATRVGLAKTYQLFVLDAKAGLFMGLDSLPNGKYTPEGWQHGYSRGVALDRVNEQAIFWFDIW
jgi:hypothetical protein